MELRRLAQWEAPDTSPAHVLSNTLNLRGFKKKKNITDDVYRI